MDAARVMAHTRPLKEAILQAARDAGFAAARILTGPPAQKAGYPALLVTALSYGNGEEDRDAGEDPEAVCIAPFARRNYYREAVTRLQRLASGFRRDFGRNGTESAARQRYQIRCNSPIPEKPLARASGLGARGRNSLIITKEAGSLVILAAMTLPFVLENAVTGMDNNRGDDGADFPLCGPCTGADGTGTPRCVTACPTGALRGDGVVILERCIQWYASGNDARKNDGGLAAIPPEIAAHWGRRLYGCTACQDACPHNRRPIAGTPPGDTALGILPARLNGRELLALDGTTLKARFKGTALGMAWLTADILRRNIRTALGGGTETPRA